MPFVGYDDVLNMPVRYQTFDDDYRVACPHGHTSLQPAETTETAYCHQCSRSYSYEELVDKKTDAGTTGGVGKGGADA